jgi:23S rRNA (adenine2503-C2)-methyltransferase
VTWLDLPPADAERAVGGWVGERGEPSYRARQILPYLWRRPLSGWRDASDLPGSLVTALEETAPLPRLVRETSQRSRDGTMKFLWRLADGARVESVLIPERRRRTLCVSSQAGCAFDCAFCATGRMGFGRHLAAWEITAQVRELVLDPGIGPPTHVVFMGMGEPLHNWAAVDTALTQLNDPRGFGIGARQITVSTVGLVPGLEALARRPEQFRVAWSLHSPFSDRRRLTMPVERKYPVPRVVAALRAFPRRVTFEYVMIAGYNDRPDDARELARLARDLRAHVNLLPLHPGGGVGLAPAAPADMAAFADLLRATGVNVTVRRSRGLDIAAACGQLRTAVDRASRIATQQNRDVEEELRVGFGHDPADA